METRTEAGDRHAAQHAARNFTRESYLPLEDAAKAGGQQQEEEEEEEVGFLSPREVLIITLTSITAVILIVIAAVVVILKVSRAQHFYSFALFDAKMHQIRHGQRHGGQCVQLQHWPRHNYLAVDIILMLCHLETFNQSLPYSSPNFMSVTYEGVSQTFLINIFTLFQR